MNSKGNYNYEECAHDCCRMIGIRLVSLVTRYKILYTEGIEISVQSNYSNGKHNTSLYSATAHQRGTMIHMVSRAPVQIQGFHLMNQLRYIILVFIDFCCILYCTIFYR